MGRALPRRVGQLPAFANCVASQAPGQESW